MFILPRESFLNSSFSSSPDRSIREDIILEISKRERWSRCAGSVKSILSMISQAKSKDPKEIFSRTDEILQKNLRFEDGNITKCANEISHSKEIYFQKRMSISPRAIDRDSATEECKWNGMMSDPTLCDADTFYFFDKNDLKICKVIEPIEHHHCIWNRPITVGCESNENGKKSLQKTKESHDVIESTNNEIVSYEFSTENIIDRIHKINNYEMRRRSVLKSKKTYRTGSFLSWSEIAKINIKNDLDDFDDNLVAKVLGDKFEIVDGIIEFSEDKLSKRRRFSLISWPSQA